MKTKFVFAFALLTAILLCLPPHALAQGDTVTLSAVEFHRLVYSSHVLTEMAHKPELDAVCQTLLEVHRRNPTADPRALADVLEQALIRFRTNAPVYLRSTEARDEILAVYLETLYQIPARTNFNSATLALLDVLMGKPGQHPPIEDTSAELLHAGNQSFINAEDKLAQRQTVVDDCARRALSNASYRQAMDVLVGAESGVLFAHSAEQIITNNPALSANPAMRALLSLSQSTGDGCVEISMAAIDGLLTNELQILHGTVETNRQVHLEILQRQSDLMAYLSDPGLVEAMALHEAARKDPQADLIVAAHASVNTLSELMKTRDVTRSKQVRALGNCWTALSDASFNWRLNSKLAGINQWNNALKFGKLSKGLTAGGGLAGVTMALVAGFAFPSPEQIMIEEIGKVKQMIFELGNDMHGRFDRVDGSFNTIQATLNDTLDTVNVLTNEVRLVREDILDVQLDLHRLERVLFTSFTEQQRHNLKLAINSALYYENFNPNLVYAMSYADFANYENTFYTYATDFAANSISSISSFSADDLADWNLQQQFAARPLSANLNYLKEVLTDRLGQSVIGSQPVLANPQDWFVSAYAYLQLALENPRHFRDKGMRLPPLIARGQELRNFLRALTFIGSSTSINWDLHSWLLANYEIQLNNFTSQVRVQEQQYADDHNVPALENWRQWASAVPCVSAPATTVLESRVEAPVVPPEFIPPGSPVRAGIIALGMVNSASHGLALQTGGAVTAWGANGDGQSTVPAGLSNVMAVAAGARHSLALRENKTVVAWGDSYDGKNTSPAIATNVVAIGAGADHNLAVRADGTVVGWGYNYYGQATGVPKMTGYPYASTGLVMVAGTTLSNVVAADGGFYFSLALQADGKVVAWGTSEYGETNVPPGLSDVMAIAAGGFHSLALHSNGTVTAWGINYEGQTNVPPGLDNIVAVAAGSHHSLALRGDGSVTAWGFNGSGQTNVPAGLSNVVAIAAGYHNSLALRSDGTLVVWGANDWLWTRPIRVPEGLSNVVAIAAGSEGAGVALQADGRVVSWHDNHAIPGDLADVMAISAGQTHRLALKTNGTVVAWGWNGYGECNVPGDLSSAVAVAAGSYAHSLALQADGRVRAWGYNDFKQRDVPSWLSNVVAIAAGNSFNLALRADGTVVGWGLNNQGQATGVPTTTPWPTASGVVTLAGQLLTNVVAIAAGGHSLALLADGTVRAWGNNSAGQCDVPPGLGNVVAIAAGYTHSLALGVDGSVVAWGNNGYGECNVPATAHVVAIAVGFRHSLFLTLSEAADPDAKVLRFVRSPVPLRLRPHLVGVNESVLTYLDSSLPPDGTAELSGARALLEAVVSLALPYTLERDDVLRGFLHGNEPLMELAPARTFLQTENAKLEATPNAPPMLLTEVAALRHLRFSERLNARLNDLQTTGQPEIPRLVGHTLRLLNLLRDAHTHLTNSPPPTLELWSEKNSPQLLLYGEPYTRYSLEYRDSLGGSGWISPGITNLRSEQILAPPVSGSPQRFYRALLPTP